MKSLKNYKKLQASSLMESVIATAIIAICVIMATIVFVNVFKTGHSTAFFEGSQEIQTIIHKLKEQQQVTDDMYTYPNFTIEQKVTNYESLPNLKHVQLALTVNQKRKIVHCLINVKENDVE
ncbi:hypothetical protein H2O64_15290 [Kordia sp. YSTF-M3]|uniref:Type II secretion system protein n=1 Tax=Kordia aestuariivivens TaxID=2759037 RepID=A0ABR7QBT9_9FLAO|nr:hypothetical protein [Kordia aestuariivivens]MBC8756041.1 hypothetical protein [Kordia aestuariivivens]